jgi:divalent metal cation (Fe/Co/Zn/Cd) transporter
MAARRNPVRPSPVRAAWLVSVQSVVWTVVASGIAIALGIAGDSAVLIAFGAIGLVDAVGSVALVYHFRHALKHDKISDRLEELAHRVVLIGLFVVGSGAVVLGCGRLAAGSVGGSSNAGTALAAVSLVVLIALSARKQSLGRRVGSVALVADGRLSGVGAMQAAVTLFGTAAARGLHWDWADAVAATLVGLVAIGVAIATRPTQEAALALSAQETRATSAHKRSRS